MIKLRIRCRKLIYDYGASAWRDLIDHIRYAGKVEIEEIHEDEKFVEAIINCYASKDWVENFLMKRIKQRLAFAEIIGGKK